MIAELAPRLSLGMVVAGLAALLLSSVTPPTTGPSAAAGRARQGADPADREDLPTAAETLADRWGLRIESVRMSAAGHLVDVRYRVLDPEKAAPVFERRLDPYLVDQATGKALQVPRPAKTGPLRSSNRPQAGRIYYSLFANTGGLIEAGDDVTLVAGDLRLPNLRVE